MGKRSMQRITKQLSKKNTAPNSIPGWLLRSCCAGRGTPVGVHLDMLPARIRHPLEGVEDLMQHLLLAHARQDGGPLAKKGGK